MSEECIKCILLEEELTTCRNEKKMVIRRFKKIKEDRDLIEKELSGVREGHNLFLKKLKETPWMEENL